tara:strand:- start:13458 stop:13964 length:507 start_codon:yes stop_codon:yes gene_type:complete
MAYDLALDTDGKDLSLSKGKFKTTQTVRELLRQRMYITFRAFKGEWFLNTQFGAYDTQLFLDKQVTKDILDSYFIALINSFPEVDVLRDFEGTYDVSTRTYSMTFVVTAQGQTGVYKIDLTPPGVEVAYPDPSSVFDINYECDFPDIDQTNAYYEYLNITLATDKRWL